MATFKDMRKKMKKTTLVEVNEENHRLLKDTLALIGRPEFEKMTQDIAAAYPPMDILNSFTSISRPSWSSEEKVVIRIKAFVGPGCLLFSGLAKRLMDIAPKVYQKVKRFLPLACSFYCT